MQIRNINDKHPEPQINQQMRKTTVNEGEVFKKNPYLRELGWIDENLGWFGGRRLAGYGGHRPVGVNGLDPSVQLVQLGRRENVVLGPGVPQLVHQRSGLKKRG